MSEPIKKIFMGQLSASIWVNGGKYGPFYTWIVTKRYNLEEKYTNYLGEDDVYLMPRLADKVRDWIEGHPLDEEAG